MRSASPSTTQRSTVGARPLTQCTSRTSEMADLETRVAVLETLVGEKYKNQILFNEDIQVRLRKLERIVWTASGSVIVAQGIFMFVMIEAVKGLIKVQ